MILYFCKIYYKKFEGELNHSFVLKTIFATRSKNYNMLVTSAKNIYIIFNYQIVRRKIVIRMNPFKWFIYYKNIIQWIWAIIVLIIW